MSRTRAVLQIVGITGALLLSGCVGPRTPTGSEQHESRSVDLDKSELVRAQIKMAAGELEVKGGARQLLDADFSYNVPEWKPDLRYNANGSSSNLVIEQRGPSSTSGDPKNRWNLRFNDKVPLDLRAEVGAGEARLDLGHLSLRGLEVTMGAGTLELDLRGTPTHDYSVRIRGGVGEATVRLPKDVGISATISGGLGDVSVSGLRKSGDRYVNDAQESGGRQIRLDIQGGVGSIKLIAD